MVEAEAKAVGLDVISYMEVPTPELENNISRYCSGQLVTPYMMVL